MKKNLICISQSYLNYASEEVLSYLSNETSMTLVIHESEVPHPKIEPYFSKVIKVKGSLSDNVRPVLDLEAVKCIVDKELESVSSPKDIALFCQQEDNVLLTSKIREIFGIEGDQYNLVHSFRDKIKMKEVIRFSRPDLIPKHELLDTSRLLGDAKKYYLELSGRLGSKIVIKPTMAEASFNVRIVTCLEEFLSLSEMIASERYNFIYEVDEYIKGDMYQCDSLVLNGKVVYAGLLELGCTNFEFVKGKPLSVFPVSDEEIYNLLTAYNSEIIALMGFSNGSTHHEFFYCKETGKITFLEIAARVPGGLGVPYHVKNSGINLIDANLLSAIQSPLLEKITIAPKNNVVSALLPVGHGTVTALNAPNIDSDYEIDWHVKLGDFVSSRSLVDTAGILMFWNNDKELLRKDFEKLQSWEPVTCKTA